MNAPAWAAATTIVVIIVRSLLQARRARWTQIAMAQHLVLLASFPIVFVLALLATVEIIVKRGSVLSRPIVMEMQSV